MAKWTGLAVLVFVYLVYFGRQVSDLVPVEIYKLVEAYWTYFLLQLYCLIKRCCIKGLVKSHVKSCKKPRTMFCS